MMLAVVSVIPTGRDWEHDVVGREVLHAFRSDDCILRQGVTIPAANPSLLTLYYARISIITLDHTLLRSDLSWHVGLGTRISRESSS